MSPLVDCPICKRKTEFSPANRWRPFCSERCRMTDLVAWATGSYSIASDSIDPDAPPQGDDLPPASDRR
jgi:endogenous inhibitor of DNA gyrase (YacG/DUF329 family)